MSGPKSAGCQEGVRRRYVYFVRHAESANNAAKKDDRRAEDPADTPSEPSRKKLKVSERVPDPCVTARGTVQASVTGRLLERLNVGQVWSSAMTRCLETTKHLAAGLRDVPIKIIVDLHEEGGLFAGPRALRGENSPAVFGLTQSEIRQFFPDSTKVLFEPTATTKNSTESSGLSESTNANGGWWKGGFEDREHLERRLEAVTDKIFDEVRNPTADPDTSVVIVTHGLFLDRLVKHLLRIPFDAPVFVLSENSSCSCLEIECTVGNKGFDGTKIAVMYHNRVQTIPAQFRTGHSCGGFRMPMTEFL
eukprot:GEMP01053386.1.p1 GENE.GEMP01053386.1~~GEMP01053386.1.p1  ORF type:complete len:306 (+),score=54.16 GEMP01053386.1:127-1044(+)